MNTTCDALAVLNAAGETMDSVAFNQWVSTHTGMNVDEQCHAILGKPDADAMSKLWEQQNADGGFGLTENYTSDFYDTLLVLMTEMYMQEQGYPAVDSTKLKMALYYIASQRNADGGFGYNKGDVSRTMLTAEYTLLLKKWNLKFADSDSLTAFCEQQYTGEFSEHTFMEQCTLARLLYQTQSSLWTEEHLTKLLAAQQEDGSIYNNVEDTMEFIILLEDMTKEGE